MTDSAQNSDDRPLRDESTDDLVRRYLVFSGMTKGLAQPAVKTADLVQRLFPPSEKLISYAFRKGPGRIFFGGENLKEAEKKCGQLMSQGKGVILDYAAPENGTGFPIDHYEFDVAQQIRDTILACRHLKQAHPEGTASLAIKVSTLADSEFLERVSAKLVAHEDLGKDKEAYKELRRRFEGFIRLANDDHVTPFIDAEETKINPLIRDLAYGALDKGYKLSLTLQCYLQETPGIVDDILRRREVGKPVPDIKLVRGAYMGKDYEGELKYIWAEGNVSEDKTKDGKALTDKCYDESFARLYGNVGEITAATHNQQSLDKIAALIKHPKATKVHAATLLGMGDGLKTAEGIEKIKYVPYGKEMHYFMRRGTEFAMNPVEDASGNKMTRGQSERDLVLNELRIRRNESPSNEWLDLILPPAQERQSKSR